MMLHRCGGVNVFHIFYRVVHEYELILGIGEAFHPGLQLLRMDDTEGCELRIFPDIHIWDAHV